MRRLPVALALVFLALPLLGAGVPVAPGIIGPASGPRSSPAVAAGPDQLLAVWYDGTSVVAMRVTPDGAPIDALPIRIGERGTEGGWRDIAVTWNGNDYRVIWRRERNGLSELATAAVRGDGTIAEAERQFASDGASPSIAWNGERHLVVWQSTWGGSYIRIQALDVNGAALDEPRSLGTGREPAVATNGRDFLVVFVNLTAVGQMVRGSGHLEPPVTLASPLDSNTSDGWTAVASDGDGFIALWTRYRGGIRRRLVNAEGQPAGSEIIVPADGGDVQRAVWDGSSYWLSLSDFQGQQQYVPGGTTVRRLTEDGHETGEPIVIATTAPPIPAMADGSNGVVFVLNRGQVTRFADESVATDQIYAQRLASDVSHLLSRGPARQEWPAVDSNAQATLIAWSEESGTDRRMQIRAQMHDRSMRPRAEAWFVSPSDNYQDKTAIAASDDGFLAVWFEAAAGTGRATLKGAIIAALETTTTNVIDIAGDVIFATKLRAAVASDGTDYLVVWSDWSGAMWARRISGSGALLNEPVRLNEFGPRGTWPALASNGSNYLLVWGDEFGIPCQYTCPDEWVYQISSMRIGRDGIPAPETRRTLSLPDREGFARGEYPAVTAEGDTFVATWRSWAGSIVAQRIDGSGTPSGNALPVANGFWSSIAPTPSGLRIAWQNWGVEDRNPIFWSELDRHLIPGPASLIAEDSFGWPMPTVVPLRRSVVYAIDVDDARGMAQRQILITSEPDPAARKRAVRR